MLLIKSTNKRSKVGETESKSKVSLHRSLLLLVEGEWYNKKQKVIMKMISRYREDF